MKRKYRRLIGGLLVYGTTATLVASAFAVEVMANGWARAFALVAFVAVVIAAIQVGAKLLWE